MICPACGSEDIEVDLDDETGMVTFEFCNNCGKENTALDYRRRKAQKRPLKFKLNLGFAP